MHSGSLMCSIVQHNNHSAFMLAHSDMQFIHLALFELCFVSNTVFFKYLILLLNHMKIISLSLILMRASLIYCTCYMISILRSIYS
jgi:hypothetical protein